MLLQYQSYLPDFILLQNKSNTIKAIVREVLCEKGILKDSQNSPMSLS